MSYWDQVTPIDPDPYCHCGHAKHRHRRTYFYSGDLIRWAAKACIVEGCRCPRFLEEGEPMEIHLNGTTYVIVEPTDEDDNLLPTCRVVSPWNGAHCMKEPDHSGDHGFQAKPGAVAGTITEFYWGKNGISVEPPPPSGV